MFAHECSVLCNGHWFETGLSLHARVGLTLSVTGLCVSPHVWYKLCLMFLLNSAAESRLVLGIANGDSPGSQPTACSAHL